jgi:E3 ubiquitin-protein ligase HUWE1
LQTIPVWRYARGDLHLWISALDRFDDILDATITSYDLKSIQTNDFTPKTKEMLLEILRVQRMLLENCNNRKAFASYDVSVDLVLC